MHPLSRLDGFGMGIYASDLLFKTMIINQFPNSGFAQMILLAVATLTLSAAASIAIGQTPILRRLAS
jgi:surface polysaccharide O-acyltransferase-like enzyme